MANRKRTNKIHKTLHKSHTKDRATRTLINMGMKIFYFLRRARVFFLAYVNWGNSLCFLWFSQFTQLFYEETVSVVCGSNHLHNYFMRKQSLFSVVLTIYTTIFATWLMSAIQTIRQRFFMEINLQFK
jgi:hypothetical protein